MNDTTNPHNKDGSDDFECCGCDLVSVRQKKIREGGSMFGAREQRELGL